MLDALDNPIAVAGHNNPPEPTPFDLSKTEIEELFHEARLWLDGEPITTQAQADGVGSLIDKIRKAQKVADARRVEENKPFDEGKAAVQAKYNPLIQKDKGKADLALSTCKAALKPFIEAEDARKKVEAEKLRAEAETKRLAAQEAIRAADRANLEQREAAERLLTEAKAAEKAATKAENDKASVKGGGRAITARTKWVATLTDRKEAARFFWVECPEQFDALLLTLGQDFVTAGRRTLPGFAITEQTTVQ